MRIFLIIDETHFYQPDFVADLIRKTKHDIVGAILVTKVLPKSNIERYMIRHWYFLHPLELIKLGLKKMYFSIKNYLIPTHDNGSFYSVRKVYNHFNIDYFEVKYDINKQEYLNRIKSKNPDIIVSSNSLIFKNELLKIPKYCINRHSALLPSYGGLWPVFQAVRKGEETVGVSVHTMEEKIDKGVVLSKKEISVQNSGSIDLLYQECFKYSAGVVLEAIDKIENNNITSVSSGVKPSYYSFPKKEHWKDFRKTKIRFI
ncbi:formyltransferase family protein [Aquimarina sp. 2201CG1-2-11]|uniref:formyltransferase family protein n=1 Tax=Aquimarina discodermiae TaxID=3231043 RepID=UPI0034624C4D